MSERRTVLLIAAFALLAALLLSVPAVMGGGGGRGTVHLSGDWPGAIEIDAPRAPLGEARTRAVVLTSWDKLRHVEGAAFLCGAPCEARPGPRVVRIVSLRAPRVTKDLLVRLDWDAVDGPAERDLACAARIVEAEALSLLPGELPCWEAVTRWRLPFGLGVWG